LTAKEHVAAKKTGGGHPAYTAKEHPFADLCDTRGGHSANTAEEHPAAEICVSGVPHDERAAVA